MAMKRKVVAGTVAALAVAGAGGAFAATKLATHSPGEESKAIVDATAKNLGIEPSKLSAAIQKALEDRVDAAVANGRLTKEQGAELKKRIESGDFPLFAGPGLGNRFGFGPGFGAPHAVSGGLDAAAKYLGLSEEQLRTQLNSGKSLAQIAKAQDKSVDGLKDALVAGAKDKLDAAVKAGHLSSAQEQQILKDLQQRVDDLVDGKLQLRFREHRGFGFGDRGRGFDRQGPPAFAGPSA
jgi:hypothetical protein